jgi:hypothetical protein
MMVVMMVVMMTVMMVVMAMVIMMVVMMVVVVAMMMMIDMVMMIVLVPQHFLYFFPLPHGQEALGLIFCPPTFGSLICCSCSSIAVSSSCALCIASADAPNLSCTHGT